MIVSRTCTEISQRDGGRARHGGSQSRPLEQFREALAYVLVGDPGAGKTTAFEGEREEFGEQACLVTAHDFRTFDPQHHPEWHGKTLFIDGLDEIRAGASDVRSPFHEIRAKLDALGKPRFRLSCREADWLGENDRKHLESVSPDSQVKVLRLDPLTDADIASILKARRDIQDAGGFVEEARKRGVDGLLANPQTLEMLADVVAGGAGWPKSRMETFEKACRQMVREHNEEHEAAQESGSPPSPEQLLDASGRLCALQLISGGAGYTLRGELDEEYPTLDRCDYDSQALRFALSSKLFKGVSTNRFSPVHRHIAEFLGGRYLAGVIQGRLPARRVIALMEGEDGTVVTEMRGLSAWLAAHSRDARADLIERDSIGVGLYGDIGWFSNEEKRALLESLNSEGKRLGSVWWTAGALGALGTPDMEPVIKEVLADSSREEDHQAFVEFILNVLRSRDPLSGLSEVLLAIVRDETRGRRVNALALDAFLRCPDCPGKTSKLRKLLADIRTGSALDPSNLQLGMLLSHLYPRELPPSEVWDYLRDDPLKELAYVEFWKHDLLDQSSDEEVAELLDSFQVRRLSLRRVLNSYLFRGLPGRLLSRGLEKHGHELDPERLYNWLSVGSEQSISAHDKESVDYIRSWLEGRPEIQKAIVMEGLLRCPESDEFWRHSFNVLKRWYSSSPPSDFGLWCLEQAAAVADDRPLVAEQLLDWSFKAHRYHAGNAGLSLEVLQEWTQKKARLRERLDQLLSPSPALKEYPEDEKQRRREEEKERQQWFDHVRSSKTALLENRAAPRLLHDMAELYFGRKAVEERLRGDRGLIDAVLRGLRGTIERKDVPELEEILRLREQNEVHSLALPFLAGIAEVEKETDVSQWEDDRVRKAIAFYYSSILSNHKPQWYRRLLSERPETVAEVQVQFAVSGFRSGREHIDKLSELALDDDHTQVARHASLPLLRAFPTRCKATQMQDLKYLLRAALQFADRGSLRDLIGDKCSQKSIDDAQRVYWLATGIIVEPEGYSEGLEEFVQGREDRISHLVVFLENLEKFTSDELDNPLLESLIRLVGNFAKPDQFWNDEPGRQYIGSEVGASELVHGLIRSLSTSLEEDAIAALGRLLGDKTLSHWHDVLSRAQDAQRVIRRDASYRHPDIDQVCLTLNGGTPANAADLADLLTDRFQELARDIRRGNTDDWRQYWNEPHGRSPTPKHEDHCRDALLSDLQRGLPEGVDAQPEGHYANDKRADIRVSCRDFQVPVEAKKNTHRDLWSAPRNQLIAKYTTDPATGGHGIYLVFWFGRKGTPPPPSGPPPATAEELQERLQATLTPVEARKISVCVIDVSRPQPAR